MARGKRSYEKDLRLLIRDITDFEEEEENFSICLEFALSNLKYHRFLDPDSHKIQRSIDGLIEKFQIHSQNEKGEALKVLVEKFLETAAFEDRDHGKTTTHYSLLSLLLSLSHAPLTVPYEEPAERAPPEKVDSFDWASYLLEDTRVYTGPFDESSGSSDGEDQPSNDGQRLTFAEVTEETLLSEAAPDRSSHVTWACDLQMEGFDWLRRNVIVQYWSQSAHVPCHQLSHRECNLLCDWEAYLSRVNPLFVRSDKMQVTEYHIIRETIWLLSGVSCSVVYLWNGTEYKPNDSLCVTHLTQESLLSLLNELCHYGMIVRQLHAFVDDTSQVSPTGCRDSASTSTPKTCQTYQAFAAASSVILMHIQKKLTSLEKRVLLQEETHTLVWLLKELKPLLIELDALEDVYTNGIAAFGHVTSSSERALGLLNAVFEALMECDNMGEYSQKKMSLLLMLWIHSCKPYLDIIDQWTTRGELVDPHNEFIIQRNIDIRSMNEYFWDAAFVLHCSQLDVDGATPRFLLPILNKIILAGKSVELLQSLGHLSKVKKASNQKSLYDKFIESIQAEIALRTEGTQHEGNGKECLPTEGASPVDPGLAVYLDNIAEQMRLPGTSDPLLRINFINIFHSMPSHVQSPASQSSDSPPSPATFDGLMPVQLLLERCLYPHVSDESATLLDVLKQDYQLDHYFAVIRRYFLLEAGDMMYDFYGPVFDKLRFHEAWQDVSFLNHTLQEALHCRHPKDAENVYVTVEARKDKRGQHQQLLTALDGLTLHYKVPWPVNIVINSKCLPVYNEVFSFLLQIKRVKYSLDELRFTDLERADLLKSPDLKQRILGKTEELAASRRAVIHRAHLTRMKLMYFVNNLHNYVMTRILHSTELEFKAVLVNARNLDDVIKAHNSYINKVHERCLLHKKVKLIKDIVTKVLELALVFALRWEEGIDNLSEKHLADLEGELSRCIQFLSSFLNNFIKRGSFPHLESLAFALVTSNEASQ